MRCWHGATDIDPQNKTESRISPSWLESARLWQEYQENSRRKEQSSNKLSRCQDNWRLCLTLVSVLEFVTFLIAATKHLTKKQLKGLSSAHSSRVHSPW